MTSITEYDPSIWRRKGRGRELQFFATDEDARRFFSEVPTEFGPYTILSADLIQQDERYRRVVTRLPFDSWLAALAEDSRSGRVGHFWLHPGAFAPVAPAEIGEQINSWSAVNGLVLVQHGATREGKRLASRIAVVDKIINQVTGEVVQLRWATSLYEALARRIRKDLKYASLQVFKDGHAEEDLSQLMTPAAAELARVGMFTRVPGDLVRE